MSAWRWRQSSPGVLAELFGWRAAFVVPGIAAMAAGFALCGPGS
jgi:sugar phosphate permease